MALSTTSHGSVILPISKVGFGFASGGSEFKIAGDHHPDHSHPFGGGSGGGVSITPVAFLVVGKQGVRSIPLENSTHLYDRILDSLPQIVDKFSGMCNSKKNQGEESCSHTGPYTPQVHEDLGDLLDKQ